MLLREDEGQRYLPIFIGPPEATAIVYALQGMETPRPMTHDLFKTCSTTSAPSSMQVVITELHDGTFYAEIEIARRRAAPTRSRPGRPTPSPSRSATREPVPIFAEEDVLDEAGVLFEQDEDEERASSSSGSSSTRSAPKTSPHGTE